MINPKERQPENSQKPNNAKRNHINSKSYYVCIFVSYILEYLWFFEIEFAPYNFKRDLFGNWVLTYYYLFFSFLFIKFFIFIIYIFKILDIFEFLFEFPRIGLFPTLKFYIKKIYIEPSLALPILNLVLLTVLNYYIFAINHGQD